ncbi:MAG: hypothetical protein ACLUHC_02275 [Clostridia bacterium]
MNVRIFMTREQCRRDKEFVIYNYIASQIKVEPEKMRIDLKEKYGLEFTKKEVEDIITEYVRAQMLSPRLRYYIRKG